MFFYTEGKTISSLPVLRNADLLFCEMRDHFRDGVMSALSK